MTNLTSSRFYIHFGTFFSSSCLSLAIFLTLNPVISYAQQNYTPLKQGDYEVRQESEFFNPGIIVEGNYKANYTTYKNDFVTGEGISDTYLQDIELRFRSTVNTNISVHAYLGNKSKLVTDQDDPYSTDYPDEAGDTTSDGAFDLEFREAYLEYNHNPNARLKIGKQFINVGDRIGMIYQGRANAITQGCRIGTWCYYVGGARLGRNGDSALVWLQIDYPVYESGVLVSDPWIAEGVRQEVSFNVELMRVGHRGANIPMSRTGIWIGEGSVYHDTKTDGSYIYFENDSVEYYGFNLKVNYMDTLARMSWISLSGKRDYYARPRGGSREFISTKTIGGNAVNLDLDYRLHKNWKGGLTLFTASGNEPGSDGKQFWEDNSQAYLEVQSGDFGDALIYFNGREGLGQGHSISNLTFYALRASYISDKKNVSLSLEGYSFSRTEPVFYNAVGEEEKKSHDIGRELDFTVDWKLEEKLQVGLQLALFNPGPAYSPNDNIRPTDDTTGFSFIGARLTYQF